MPPKTLSKDLYADHSPTHIQRIALTTGVALAWWLLLYRGDCRSRSEERAKLRLCTDSSL